MLKQNSLQESGSQNTPSLGSPQKLPFSKETAPFIPKFDHPKLKNGFPRPKDYISNTYITSKTKAVTYGSVS